MAKGTDQPPARLEIVDRERRFPFIQVERAIMRAKGLSDRAKILYCLLLDYAWQANQCFPGQQRLAADLGASVDTVQRALAELKQWRLIDWKQRGLNRPNVYYILPLDGNPRLALETPATRLETAPVRFPESAAVRFQDTAAVRNYKDSGDKDSEQQHTTSVPVTSNGHAPPTSERVVVENSLTERGVSPRAARTLAQKHPPDRIREQIAVFDWLQRQASPLIGKSPPGWLRRAIEEDWQPPPEYEQARDAELRRRERNQQEHQRRLAEARAKAATFTVPVAEQARRNFDAWQALRQKMGKPPLTEPERAEWLAGEAHRLAAERAELYHEFPELAPPEQLLETLSN
jgi:hypothetical protein